MLNVSREALKSFGPIRRGNQIKSFDCEAEAPITIPTCREQISE